MASQQQNLNASEAVCSEHACGKKIRVKGISLITEYNMTLFLHKL